MNDPEKRTQPDESKQPDRHATPGRTPGTADGGEDHERRGLVHEPGPTPGTAEGGPYSDGPPRH